MKRTLGRYWSLLLKYLGPQWLRVILLGILILTSIALQLINPQIIRAFIDAAQAGDTLRSLLAAGLTYLGVALAAQTMSIAIAYVGENVAWTATNALRRDLTLHALTLDMSFHKAHTPGELIERIDGDVTALAEFFSQLAIRLLSNVLLALGIVIVLFGEDWRIGLAGTGYACLTAVALRAVQRRAVAAWGDSRQVESELFGFLGERLTATEDIRANGAEAYVMAGLHRLMRSVLYAWRKAQLVQGLSRGLESVVYVLTYVGALGMGASLFLRGQMTIGTVYLLTQYLGRLRAPILQIRSQVDNLRRASASVARVEALLRTRPQVIDSGRASLPLGPLRVALEGVHFRYEDASQGDVGDSVLHDLSFQLEPGRVLGLLGRTGSGKTTLTRLLFRLYDPAMGAVRLGDVDLRDLSLSELRKRVGLVTQDVQLLSASVRDNVALFSSRISDQQIEAALRELGLWEWYRALPDGLDTPLGAGGDGLSAGEAQLLAFTRVYLKDPGLILMDEASSRLDPATERLLERAIDRLLQDRTAIIVAHRLATVGRADQILVLEEGRVAEHGNRQILAGDPASRFYQLLQTGLEEVLA